MSVTVGGQAPDFTLPDQDRQPVTASAQWAQGPVVLAFFPAAFSDHCTQELCTFRDSMAEFDRVSARVFGISVDAFFALKAWRDVSGFGFSLLSDFNKVVIRQYGVFNEDMIGLKGIAKRAVFVIDRGGIVRYAEILDDARNFPDYAKVRAAVAAIG